MSARLRVGIATDLARLGGPSGHGRVWEHVLRTLRDRVTLTTEGPVDVHLLDGHGDARPVGGAPIVSVVHDVRWADPAQRDALPLMYLVTILPATAATVAASTRVIVPAAVVREQLVAEYGFPAEHVDRVPYGVDAAVFSPRAHLPGGRPYVAFVGAVEPRKRIDVVRGAMGVLADQGFPHRLALRVSAAPWTESRGLLAAATAELPGHPGRVAVLPRLDDHELAWMLAGADALCLPSECEGFGLPVLEAMACGTPVVVADRGALPEVVGDAGVIAAPTIDATAAALASVLGDPERARELARRGRARAETHSWAATADGYVASLTAAIDTARGPSPVPAAAVTTAPAWLPVVVVAVCPVCDADRAVADPVPGDPDLARCTRCGCVWADRRLDPERFDESLPRRMPTEWSGVPLDPHTDAARRHAAARHRLAALADSARPPGRLWVIAPDPQPLVDAARAAGWDATGATGLGPAPDADAPFDAVALIHRLTDSPAVVGALHDLADAVTPGGTLLVEVPNWNAATRRRDGAGWHHRRPLESVAFLDPATLRHALESAGWSPQAVTVRTWPIEDPVAASHSLPPFRRALRRLPERGGTAAAGVLRHGYDRIGLGDVIVATARLAGGPRVSAPAGAPPRGPGAPA